MAKIAVDMSQMTGGFMQCFIRESRLKPPTQPARIICRVRVYSAVLQLYSRCIYIACKVLLAVSLCILGITPGPVMGLVACTCHFDGQLSFYGCLIMVQRLGQVLHAHVTCCCTCMTSPLFEMPQFIKTLLSKLHRCSQSGGISWYSDFYVKINVVYEIHTLDMS